MIGWGLPVAFVVAAGVAQLFKGRHHGSRRAWARAADELGLDFEAGDDPRQRRIVGRIHGHEVTVRVLVLTRDGRREHNTVYELRFAEPLAFALTLRTEGLLSGIGKLVGLRDTEVGDPIFDAQVLVESEDPAALHQWLSAERRTHIRRFLMSHTQAHIDELGLRWVAPYLHDRPDVVAASVRNLVNAADQLAGRGAPPVPEVREPVAEEDVLRDPVAVADALFGPAHQGSDLSECFEADLADRPVAWHGILRKLEVVTVDYTFGDGPFTRATFELRRRGRDHRGTRTLSAVVRLPVEEGERLRQHVGQSMVIEGRLWAVDPFARSFFVAEGAVRAVGWT